MNIIVCVHPQIVIIMKSSDNSYLEVDTGFTQTLHRFKGHTSDPRKASLLVPE